MIPVLAALARADEPAACEAPDLPSPAEALSVAWVSPLRRRAGADRWLVVVPTADLRDFAEGEGVGRTLQRLGLRRRPTDPRRRWKVVVFDVPAAALCRPLRDRTPGEVVADVATCDERRSAPRGRYDGCGWLEDAADGSPSAVAYRARWRDLAPEGFCVLPMERFVGSQ